MLPGASKLNALELFGLAQAALAHNLDPFNGELWCIPGKGLMAGIKGHRRAAHQQIERESGGGGNYYTEFFQLTIDEMTALKIPAKSLAFRARLHDSQTTRAYVDSIERMLKAGMPWEVVSRIMGDSPYTEGIGYYVDGESTKMTPVQVSQKRAEADALKRRFDLPFTMCVGVNGDSDMVDAEFSVVQAQPEQDPTEVQARMQHGASVLRGDQGDIDLGPDWGKYPTDHTDAERMTDHPTELPSEGKTNGASVKSASIKHQPFVTWCNEWIKSDARAAQYAKESGGANMYLILCKVAKLGFAEVNIENVEDVKAVLAKSVEVTA